MTNKAQPWLLKAEWRKKLGGFSELSLKGSLQQEPCITLWLLKVWCDSQWFMVKMVIGQFLQTVQQWSHFIPRKCYYWLHCWVCSIPGLISGPQSKWWRVVCVYAAQSQRRLSAPVLCSTWSRTSAGPHAMPLWPQIITIFSECGS